MKRRFPGIAGEGLMGRRRKVQNQPVSLFISGFQDKGLGHGSRRADIENEAGIAGLVEAVSQFTENACGAGQRTGRQTPADFRQIDDDPVRIGQGKDAEGHLPVDVEDHTGDVLLVADADIGDNAARGLGRNRPRHRQQHRQHGHAGNQRPEEQPFNTQHMAQHLAYDPYIMP